MQNNVPCWGVLIAPASPGRVAGGANPPAHAPNAVVLGGILPCPAKDWFWGRWARGGTGGGLGACDVSITTVSAQCAVVRALDILIRVAKKL